MWSLWHQGKMITLSQWEQYPNYLHDYYLFHVSILFLTQKKFQENRQFADSSVWLIANVLWDRFHTNFFFFFFQKSGKMMNHVFACVIVCNAFDFLSKTFNLCLSDVCMKKRKNNFSKRVKLTRLICNLLHILF